jgi:hypothetical protein
MQQTTHISSNKTLGDIILDQSDWNILAEEKGVPASFIEGFTNNGKKSFEDVMKEFAPSFRIHEGNPSAILKIQNLKCEKVFFVVGAHAGLTEEQQKEMSNVVDYISTIIKTTRESLGQPFNKDEIVFTDTMTIRHLYDEAKKEITEATTKRENYKKQRETLEKRPTPTLLERKSSPLRDELISEFNLAELSEEEQEEILVEVAKTIQKQFIYDIYDVLGQKDFEALQASANMGEAFYETTLKHLVPDAHAMFIGAKAKVVKAFHNG